MATVISIDPAGIYDDALLCDLLGVSAQALTHARRSGELRSTRKGQRILYLGQWVLDWLKADEGGPHAA
jgi:hypothetical protein